MDDLIFAWLKARSLARGLAMPVADQGGWRVDTGTEEETARWIFPRICPGLLHLGASLTGPNYLLKLCGSQDELTKALGPDWTPEQDRFFMVPDLKWSQSLSLPEDYQVVQEIAPGQGQVKILAKDGKLAASGYFAETPKAFVYDRIETYPEHRRKGLARALVGLLAQHKTKPMAQDVLVATEMGRMLYESLGWRVLTPYSTTQRRT